MYSYLTDDPAGADLTFSPCQEDELAECVAHVLTCRESDSWSDVEFTIIYGDVEKIVTALVVGTAGTANADLILKGRADSVPLQIPSIQIDSNELDVAWMMTLSVGNSEDIFEAITAASAEGAKLIVGGESFTLAPQAGDGSKLVKFKEACMQNGQ